MSVAVGVGGQVWLHDGAGGAKASAALIPTILGLLSQAGLRVAQLDAIAFGRGPGAWPAPRRRAWPSAPTARGSHSIR